MLVICDSSPLRYLCELGVSEVLPLLYGQVMTTPDVIEELAQAHFPSDVRQWAASPPPWLAIERPRVICFTLGRGESSALSLAHERRADLVLIDERAGTAAAQAAGLATSGTLGVLMEAGLRGHLDFEQAIQRLVGATRFRHTSALIDAARGAYADLRRQMGCGPDPS